MTAAKVCLRESVQCPKTCPLLQEINCQKIIFREAIRMYEELRGNDDEEEQVCEEEETQEGT